MKKERKPIQRPIRDDLEDGVREVSQALVAGVPVVGGPLNILWDSVDPSPADRREDQWRKEITERVNEIDQGPRPYTLSEHESQLVCWLIKNCPKGRPQLYEPKELQEEVGLEPERILETAYSLEQFGVLDVLPGGYGLRLTPAAYQDGAHTQEINAHKQHTKQGSADRNGTEIVWAG